MERRFIHWFTDAHIALLLNVNHVFIGIRELGKASVLASFFWASKRMKALRWRTVARLCNGSYFK